MHLMKYFCHFTDKSLTVFVAEITAKYLMLQYDEGGQAHRRPDAVSRDPDAVLLSKTYVLTFTQTDKKSNKRGTYFRVNKI